MRVAPLLTLRGCSPEASQGAAVGAAAFLAPSRLAVGDTEGRVSVLDLDTRRPCLVLPPSDKASGSPTDPAARRASLSSALSSSSWSPSPVLLLEALGGRTLESPVGARLPTKRCDGEDTGVGGGVTGVDKLLAHQRSSAVTLWDLEALREEQSFRTGSFSFCRLAVLGDPHSGAEEAEKATSDCQREGPAECPSEDCGAESLSSSSTLSPSETSSLTAAFSSCLASPPRAPPPWPQSAASTASPRLPLLACPVAEAEAIGIFDLRARQQTAVARPALLLKRSPFASRTSVPSLPWGMVQAIAHVPKLASPHIVAAYERPCVALWDLRQSRAPLSSAPLSSRDASPPSALTVHRNQCWVGCFDGELSVLKIRKSGDLHLQTTLHLFPEKNPTGLGSVSLASTKLSAPSLPHPEGDLARSRLLLSAAFRPDGAVVAVGASDGGVRLFEAKSARCLGTLEASRGSASQGDTAGTASVIAWCPRSGVLASGGGVGGRIALWGLYTETFRSAESAATQAQ
ncbi:conserved hypothetical protein [Neospora caninum Liverpool]|uniref:WD domain, G-beta repeat-containing protein n=1 Tax=Neospora caninum (strain Liverpool) TaxID=572307 RepID=F0VJU2_NEOCL|nr:conserved hypothetical protein [Neospora caninum Liverpool]CBZ54003.1 conserved hypothetical protein [Neospora caninum Liverpool]CEL68005.1 TPA: hypothetical protein BN1204_037850 [Neospora caninum Liverpool]|eukprot:XP_003884035.1 conserved hypothetical protein [Neospora caninum Liverpool]